MDAIELAAIALEDACAHLPNGGERRPGQEAMTRMVAESIADGNHLVVQAGTGTGKSLAYLVPAILSGRQTVVATATKALQDQLATKDLPFLVENLTPHLEREIVFSVLKGRSNYLCLQRLDEVADSRGSTKYGQKQLDGLAESADPDQLDVILEWAEQTTTGDRSDLSVEPSVATWAAVSVGSNECPGAARCPRGEECFAEEARASADVADVVVTNLHLYGIDVATDGAVLPPHDIAVLDEVHQIEDVLARSSGFELRSSRFRALVARSSAILANSAALMKFDELSGRLDEALRPHLGQRLVPADSPSLRSLLQLAQTRLDSLQADLRNIPNDGPADTGARRTRALKAVEALASDVEAALDLEGGPIPGPMVAWAEGSVDHPSLHVAPIAVAEILQTNLWGRQTVVMTSATIPENLARRIGLKTPEGEPTFSHRVEDVGSPFNFETQSLLYCATSMPDPREETFAKASHDEIERLATAAGGRMLALFTSRSALDAAVNALRDRLPWEVMHQDDLPKPSLLAQFAADETSCLFGTRGLWHGIDIPGPSLSLLVIDRVPFPRPDDPLLSARRDIVGRERAFREIDLPIAATELAQGVGRLIRSRSDRGLVAVLDRRLATSRAYRWDLLQALPDMPRTGDRAEALDFLARLND